MHVMNCPLFYIGRGFPVKSLTFLCRSIVHHRWPFFAPLDFRYIDPLHFLFFISSTWAEKLVDKAGPVHLRPPVGYVVQ